MIFIYLPSKYIPIINDILKITNIVVVYLIIQSIYRNNAIDFEHIAETIFMLILGVLSYWLLFNEAIEVKEKTI